MVKTKVEYYDDISEKLITDNNQIERNKVRVVFPFRNPMSGLDPFNYEQPTNVRTELHFTDESLRLIGIRTVNHFSKKYNNYESFIKALRDGKF